MRIILDNGAYSLRNMGDVAMLQVAVKRLRSLLDSPDIAVLTTSPELLTRYCPDTHPLAVSARDSLYPWEHPALSDWREAWAGLKRRWASVPVGGRQFHEELHGADAVFLCGGGFLNDLNPYQTRPVFRMLTDAACAGKVTAMFSQGLGPLEIPDLLCLLKRACHEGTQAGLREGLHSPAIMERAGVKAKYHTVTGDDAIEPAWEHGAARADNAVGFSVRQVAYSEIGDRHLNVLAQSLKRLSKYLSAKTVGIPISFNPHEQDEEVIRRVLDDSELRHMDSPEALMAEVARCRMVVTGTYHAAVFALARGIPCLCFYVSPYYRNKMQGLARQFPEGCELLDLNPPDAGENLIRSGVALWERCGNRVASALRKSAEEQVISSREFYRRVTRRLRRS